MPLLRELGAELIYPLRTMAVLPAILLFALLLSIVMMALHMGPVSSILSLFLLAFILPPLLRFLLTYVEARARDREPPVLDSENFAWMSEAWSLFPILPLSAAAGFWAWSAFRGDMATAQWIAAGTVAVYPASLAVLAMTHSPLESLNPFALGRFLARSWRHYWFVPLLFTVATLLLVSLSSMPGIVLIVLALVLATMCCGVLGVVIRRCEYVDDPWLDSVDDVRDEPPAAISERQREHELGIAYGFASRNNLQGALDHLAKSMADDAGDPGAWYLERMLGWEDRFPAMKFAQLRLHELLAQGREREANKLAMRCHAIDARFRPLPDDRDRTIEILERFGNAELANAFRR